MRTEVPSNRSKRLLPFVLSAGVAVTVPAMSLAEPVTATLRPYAPGTPQFGLGGTPDRPSRAVLRQDEDWSWLRDRPRSEWPSFGAFKYIPLDATGTTFATLAFDGRLAYEYFDDEGWGAPPGSDGSAHLRANAHAAVQFGERARLYGALKFGRVEGKRSFVPPAEDDGPDVHQAFAELAFGDLFGLPVQDAFVRAGRQELHYGSGRLVSRREGPNVRSDFDGLTIRTRVGATIAEAFLVRPTEDVDGPFDNGTDESRALWGAYASTALGEVFVPGGQAPDPLHLDTFYMGQRRDVSPYAFLPAPVSETRHTLGARLWTAGRPTDGLNIEIEGGFQFGSADEYDIRAAYAAGDLSFGFGSFDWTPIVGLRFGVSSGDGDADDRTIGTFRAPAPPGRYFGESNPIGPGNVAGLGPYLTVSPAEGLTLTVRLQGFWRLQDEDGLYIPPQAPLRGPVGGEAFVGAEASLIASYALDPNTTFDVTLSHFEAGPFLADNPPGEDITYGHARLTFAF